VVRSDATVIAFTSHDRDITYGGVTYLSSISYTPSNKDANMTLSVNNSDMSGYFSIGGIVKEDVENGLYDGAEVYELIVDYSDSTLIKNLGKGFLGEVEITENGFKAEYRSLTQKLQQPIGRYYTAECNAQLGDTRCGVTIADFTYTGAITSVTSNQAFIDSSLIGTQSDDYYNYGLITCTSGLNSGLSREVKDYTDATGQITTFLPFAYDVVVADTFTVYAGCDKRKTTCISTFNNVINFRGFDMIPSSDQVTKFGGQ
jgi:uncharacterized phage protein (TIGR02218 family)